MEYLPNQIAKMYKEELRREKTRIILHYLAIVSAIMAWGAVWYLVGFFRGRM